MIVTGPLLEMAQALPSGWKLVPLKRVAAIRYGLGQPPPTLDGGVPLLRATNVTRGLITEAGLIFVDPEGVPPGRDARLRAGEIIVVRSGAYTGDSAIVPDRFDNALTGYDMVVRATAIDARFLAWQFLAEHVVNYQFALVKSRAAQPHLNAEDLGETLIAVPSTLVQRRTADLLDRETTKIDALISRQAKFIQSILARQEALLSSPHRNPSHAPMVRVRFVADILPGNAFSSSTFELAEEGVRLLRGINVAPGRLDWTVETVYLSKDVTLGFDRFTLLSDDIVIGMDRPWISSGLRIARLSQKDVPSLLVQRVARLRCGKEVYPEYLEYCLRTREFMAHVLPDMTGVSVPHISDRQIGDFRIPLPPIGEQQFLVSEIRESMALGGKLISKLENMIAIARERRAALITAAVTGQIDVTSPAFAKAAA